MLVQASRSTAHRCPRVGIAVVSWAGAACLQQQPDAHAMPSFGWGVRDDAMPLSAAAYDARTGVVRATVWRNA